MKKNFFRDDILRFAAFAAIIAASAAMAAEMTLTADSMRYDPGRGVIFAVGNVHVTSPDGEAFGDEGSGTTDGNGFDLRGHVRGHYKDSDGGVVNFSCGGVTVGTRGANRVVTASGDVKLAKGGDNLSAQLVVWNTGEARYSAAGDVLGESKAYSIDADAVSRDLENFSAREVRKLLMRERGITMSASRVQGVIKDEAVDEMIAEGGVVVTMPGKDGVVTRATGRKCVYSVGRGTIVLSGNATITQTGRVLHSDSIVYFIETGHIDAHGSPSITFDTDRKK